MFGRKPITITVSRTVSKNYQSVIAGFCFEVPSSVKLPEALKLADFMVDARITGKFEAKLKKKYRGIYARCFPGEELSEFLSLIQEKD